ncbi:MAG: N-acetylmuramoyl-L-alanine amidase [Alphaproteobacteria bacterium]|nr:N-acetylmuramoyl-L-alanine amidase [Alphaproteobacteria bacterium]
MHIEFSPSPNFNDRGAGAAIDMLVMHYTGMKTAEEALQRMCSKESQVSAHYMVDEDGAIYQLVDEDKRAWHAGVSFWRGETDINSHSIGIEIVNPGHEFGYREFPDVQMQSVIWLSQQILERHPIPARNVVAHSDIAPTRKQDPGELFNWQMLADNGVGLWVVDEGEVSAQGAASNDEKAMLANIGYDVFDFAAAADAFHLHFGANTSVEKINELL